MIQSTIATLKIRPGTAAEFEAVASQLVAASNTEAGCLSYSLNKAEEADTYVFMERYRDEAAVEAHRKSEHFRKLGREMGAFMAGPPAVQRMQEVAGPAVD